MYGREGNFLVVAENSVVRSFNDLNLAKEVLAQLSKDSRLIAEMRNGEVVADPHQIAGQNQNSENGFNKHWTGWDDINRMIALVKNYGT